MERGPFTIYLYEKYYPVVSKISAFTAFFVVLFMIVMSFYDRKLIDRISLRLQTGVALYDVLFHTGFLWRTPFYDKPSPYCTFIGWTLVFLPLFYFFLNVSIGVNLQLIFIHNKTITKRIEMLYWAIPIIAGLIISLPPLVLGQLGYSEYLGCYIAEGTTGNDPYGKMLDFFGSQLWRSLSMIYLFVIVILVFIKLNRGAILIDSNDLEMNNTTSSQAVKTIKSLGYRILLYPITMLISQLFNIVSQLAYDFSPLNDETLDQLYLIFLPWAGLLNFLAFCCDPTVHHAIKVIYRRITKKDNAKNDDYETNVELGNIDGSNEVNNIGNQKNESKYNDHAISSLIKSL